MRRTITRSLTVVAGVIAVGILASPSAYAGEITGNGKSLKNPDGSLNGASVCAFSGQNDTYSGDPDVPDEDGFTRTQNWGQVGREGRIFLTSIGLHPMNTCKPGAEEPEH